MEIKIENTEESIAAAISDGITTPELAKNWIDYVCEEGDEAELMDGVIVIRPRRWIASDGNAEVEYTCDSGEKAAKEYVRTGDWGDRSETTWIHVSAWRMGVNAAGEIVQVDRESHTITLDAEEPPCIDDREHNWQAPHDIVGGLEENPGVYGHGGGVTITTVCMRCGCQRVVDTWAQDREDGTQGLESVSYEPGRYAEEVMEKEEENG